MSSVHRNFLAPSDLAMLDGVLQRAGFHQRVEIDDQDHLRLAAGLLVGRSKAGVTAAETLLAELQSRNGLRTPRQVEAANLERWENDGGAPQRASAITRYTGARRPLGLPCAASEPTLPSTTPTSGPAACRTARTNLYPTARSVALGAMAKSRPASSVAASLAIGAPAIEKMLEPVKPWETVGVVPADHGTDAQCRECDKPQQFCAELTAKAGVSRPRVQWAAYSLISRSFVTSNTSIARALLSRITPMQRSLEKLRETVSIVMPR